MFDILICGAGPSGLVSALTFAKQGYKVAVIDPKERDSETTGLTDSKIPDFRSTAHLNPTVEFLKTLGVWDDICANSCPLEKLIIIDDQHEQPIFSTKKKIVFRASEIGQSCFGYNLPIKDNLFGLSKLVKANKNITCFFGVALQDIIHKNYLISAQLSDGKTIDSKLIIGADGSGSKVRESLGIDVQYRNTRQTALSFHITHDKPHHNSSTEIYSEGGPFTVVPLIQKNGLNTSAVVWMQTTEKARFLLDCVDDVFREYVQKKSLGVVGNIRNCSTVSSREIVIQIANKIVAKRAVLIGEAAHLLPPIGAQGYNSSIKDIMTLSQLVGTRAWDPGESSILRKYSSIRMPDLYIKTGGIGLLNFLAWTNNPLIKKARLLGLNLIDSNELIKKSAIRFGLS